MIFVKLSYFAFDNPAVYFSILGSIDLTGIYKGEKVQFIDGMVLSPQQNYLILGSKVDTAPYVSKYKNFCEYYQSIPLRSEDYMTLNDFYKLEGRLPKQTDLIKQAVQTNSFTQFFASKTKEHLNQTIQIPLENAKHFFDFFHKKIAIVPLWLYPNQNYITFRFNDVVTTEEDVSENYFSNLVKKETARLNGKLI